MADVNVTMANTASDIILMMLSEGRRFALVPIPDECMTIDCALQASRILFMFGDGRFSISYLCESCSDEAKNASARLVCGAIGNGST